MEASSQNPASRAREARSASPDPRSYDPNRNLASKDPDAAPTYTVESPSAQRQAQLPVTSRAVPDVRGLSVRAAVRTLHNAGFRVRLVTASANGTFPAAGTSAAPGTIVQLVRPLE